jgi:hypothetical protein
MKTETNTKKLILKKETLRDLMARNAGQVKGGGKTNGKKCVSNTCDCGTRTCAATGCYCETAGCPPFDSYKGCTATRLFC